MTAAPLDPQGVGRLLARVLADTPRLDGAACVGLWEAFDSPHPGEEPAEVAYRHRAALAVCRRCPARRRCAEWAAGLRGNDRPDGILAGQSPRRKTPATTTAPRSSSPTTRPHHDNPPGGRGPIAHEAPPSTHAPSGDLSTKFFLTTTDLNGASEP